MNRELLQEAAELVVKYQMGSVSLLCRYLKVSYNDGVKLIDALEANNIVGPFQGSAPRLVKVQKTEDIKLN